MAVLSNGPTAKVHLEMISDVQFFLDAIGSHPTPKVLSTKALHLRAHSPNAKK